MANQGISQAKLARAIGMSAGTLSSRMKRGNFGADEMLRIANVLQLSNPAAIFFGE